RRAPWIITGALVGSLALVALRYSTAIPLIAVFWAIANLAITGVLGPMNATVADRVAPTRRGLASTVQGLGTLVGSAIGAILAASLFATLGLDTYFPLAILLPVGCLLFVLFARDQSSKLLDLEPMRWGAFFRGFLEPLRSHDFRWAWIARAIVLFGSSISSAFSLYMLQSYVQPAMSAEEATATVPLLTVALIPAALLGLSVAGPLSDRLGRRKPFVFWASVLMAASYIVPLVSPTLPAMVIQTFMGGIALGTYLAVDAALFLDVLPNPKTAGRDLGMASLATNLGQAAAPLVAGQIVVLTGSYSLVWAISIVIVLMAGFAVLPIKGVR
ncbi:MAG TPA: MFS transporter, partial [Tepidisphaeraceae bacterium]|nr:MFS transporter [Tepidisphaeraceae bacterium]